MTGSEWVPLAAVAILAVAVVAVLGWGVRSVRRLEDRLGDPKAHPSGRAAEKAAEKAERADLSYLAEKARREHTLSGLKAAADEAAAAVERTRAAAAHARNDAAAAKAEARAARAEASRLQDTARVEAEVVAERTAEVQRRERRIEERERLHAADLERLADRERRLVTAEEELTARQATLDTVADEQLRERERIAGLTADAARAEVVAQVTEQAKREAAVRVRDLEREAVATAEERARQVVVEAIQRVALEQTAESAVSLLPLPSDEMKGRIIGREGRNIRAFEAVTGVNVIIDDTPEAVLLSCFDPVRREVGRTTLEKLITDGRIHPHRIEEAFASAQREVEARCQRAAQDALVQVGITDLHPELATLLGHLKYRTSYGQNVLAHLVETAHLARLMAAELGLDDAALREVTRAALLHDLGKALTHEVEGSHAAVGAEVARRYGEPDGVVHAIEAHHNEVPPRTVPAVLTQAADACSGGRPGARREDLAGYVTRLERVERIAAARPGVEKAYAMQAGREVRVMVRPEEVDDVGAAVLARDLAKQVEEEVTYPGQIRITVIRELRASETAR